MRNEAYVITCSLIKVQLVAASNFMLIFLKGKCILLTIDSIIDFQRIITFLKIK